MIEAPSPPLAGAVIRRRRGTGLSASLVDDLRLFAITWAAGFVFFLAFLA